MEAFSARLKAEVGRFGGPKAFAQASGVPLSTLNTYLAGSAEPKITTVVRFARALGISVAELLSGLPGEQASGIQIHSPGTEVPADSVPVSMLDLVASAGPGVENSEPAVIQRMLFPRRLLAELGVKPEHARLWTSKGDSMVPTIRDGALILVDTSYRRVKDDGVYMIIVGNELRAKRVARGWDNALTLISDNKAYPTETLAPPDAEALRVVGRAKWGGGTL